MVQTASLHICDSDMMWSTSHLVLVNMYLVGGMSLLLMVGHCGLHTSYGGILWTSHFLRGILDFTPLVVAHCGLHTSCGGILWTSHFLWGIVDFTPLVVGEC